MRLAIMQPYTFPYLGYFQLISVVDKFVIYDDVNFIIRGWINRNNILINNKASLFTIPLKNASQNRIIRDIELSNDTPWKYKFLKTIEYSYKKAPYFDDVFPLIDHVVSFDTSYIYQLALLSIKTVLDYIKIPTEIVNSSDIYKNKEFQAQERILDICKYEKALQYINPIGGMEIYSRDFFENEGIKIFFLKSRMPVYKQFNHEFVSSLSIIDILMFNSREDVQQMLLQYELV
jgi:WbqC-like protein family